jgi:hypothetical protein
MALYELIEEPSLDAPVLVLALEGWIDAGLGASRAMAMLLDTLDTAVVARFDPDALLDYRARRPTMHLVEGVARDLTWPSTELHAATDLDGNDMLLLTGAEPDRVWRQFTDEVTDLALHFGTGMVVGLGAYPAPAPHTRSPLLACTAATPELAERGAFLRASIDVPAGVHAAIERECAARGLPSLGLWAQVPHYAAAMPYPAASASLLEGLAQAAGLALPFGELQREVDDTRAQLDELIAQNPEHVAMLRRLEEQADALFAEGGMELPSGDELAAELERYLREQRGD